MATKAKSARRPKKISHVHRPEDMSLEQWQIALRRQVSEQQPLKLRNLGGDPVFSEFAVTNPSTQRTYRVVIRGDQPGVNFCSCPDYAVNTLGTCKHIEFVLRRLRRKNAAALRKGVQARFSEVYLRYGARRAVIFSPAKNCPPAVRRAADKSFSKDGELRPAGISRFSGFLQAVERSGHDVRVYDDVMEYVAELRDAKARAARLDKHFGIGQAAKAWRSLLKVELHPYQRSGALFTAKAGRAVLADEMGLGKTIQAIACAEILARHCGVERVLVVCPASLKHQWQSEIERFSKRTAQDISGMTHVRKAMFAEQSFFKIINYDVVHRDLDVISQWQPDLVILDEAQRIKNWQTRTAKAVKQINSRFALVLTGTPLENRLEELHSIVEFVDRFRLGPLFAFKAAHEVVEDGTTKVIGYQDLDRVTRTLSPIVLRRTLKEVANQLPPRMEKNFFVPMTAEQMVHHDENRDIVAKLVHKWRKHKFLSEADQLRLRICLQYMRMSCDSTYLIDHQTRHHTKIDELCTLLSEVFEDKTSKAVIFSQWLRMNELVGEMLEDRGWGYVHLHGGVPSGDRAELIRALREEQDCRVFLSTDAGGVGLNLQAASTVINMDLPWNPAVLGQRIGRVHRLGQKRPVRVVNFISEDTIEQGMLSLLAFKKSLFAGVLDGTTDRVFMGESAMNRFMKTVETATSNIPAPQPGEREPLHDVADDNDNALALESESAGEWRSGSAARGGDGHALNPRDDALDARALGAILEQGAALLREIGQSLLTGDGRGRQESKSNLPVSLVRDDATGRPQIRLPLPDEQVLAHWVGQIGRFIGGLRSGR